MNPAPQPDPSRDDATPLAESLPASLDGTALARRRLLLKGLGKGGAVLAAVAPIQSFAQSASTVIVTNSNTLCTQSGQHSNVMSRVLNKNTCSGYKPSRYWSNGAARNWPAGVGSAVTFAALFPASTNTTLVSTLLAASTTNDNAYWIAANFNSRQQSALNFPYNLAEVRAQFASWNAGGAGSSALLNLYRNYLSSLS